MKNYYRIIAIALLMPLTVLSQTAIAGADYIEMTLPPSPQMAIANVLENDQVNGVPATFTNVQLNQIVTNDPTVSIESDGSAWYNPVGMTSPGIHYVFYRIHEIINPYNYDIAAVTFNVDGCLLPAVTVDAVLPNCLGAGTITLGNLPAGNWHLVTYRNGYQVSDIAGSGTTFSITEAINGMYHFSVYQDTSLCASVPVKCSFFSTCRLDMEVSGTYSDFNSDGSLSAGDYINYDFTITNNRAIPLNGVGITSPSPLMQIIGNTIPQLNPGESDTSFTGKRILTQEDVDNGYVSDQIDGLASDNTGVPVPVYFSMYAVTYLNLLQKQSFDATTLSVYPNPAAGRETVSADTNISEITLTDLAGNTILHKNVSGKQTVLDIANRENGIYLLTVSGTAGSKTVKLVKQ